MLAMQAAALMVPTAMAASLQDPAPVAPAAFEVASVKPSIASSGRVSASLTVGLDSVRARNTFLRNLIREANGVQNYQIVGGPAWVGSDRYDLDAKAEKPGDKDQLRLMLRTLLAERFNLLVHRETREVPAYALVVGKGGAKIQRAGDSKSNAAPATPGGGLPFRGDMHQFAIFISGMLGPDGPVVDETGLDRIYDFTLALVRDPGGDLIARWQRGLEQLGLKLEARRKVPIEFLVIDRAEKPFGN
jgi:uncharacterized protein (TIGR03435 family)